MLGRSEPRARRRQGKAIARPASELDVQAARSDGTDRRASG